MKIRFRVWLPTEKRMIYPGDGLQGAFKTRFTVGQMGALIACDHPEDTHWWRTCEEGIPMLSAGVKDGVELWESDVVKMPYNEVYDFAHYLIVWDEQKAALYTRCLALHHKQTGFKDISRGGYCVGYAGDLEGEVIGNVYENPELMEDEDD